MSARGGLHKRSWSALAMCKLVVQTGCANRLCKLVMQTARAALHERLWRAARALVESCTSARGVPLADFSLWVWGHGGGGAKGWGYVAGLGVCGRVWGHVAGCGDMW